MVAKRIEDVQKQRNCDRKGIANQRWVFTTTLRTSNRRIEVLNHPGGGSLLLGRDAIIPHVRWSVGDGRQIRIRGDCWLPRGVIGGPAAKEEPKRVADLIDPIHNSWNTSLLTSFLDDQIVAEVLTIPVRPTLVTDQLV